jgi:hypothetical protein
MPHLNDSEQTLARQALDASLTSTLTEKSTFRIETGTRLVIFLVMGIGGAWLIRSFFNDAVFAKIWFAMMFSFFGYEQLCARIDYSVRQIVLDAVEAMETRTDNKLMHQHGVALERLKALKGDEQ